jgi:MSHA biogenesis protein MshN
MSLINRMLQELDARRPDNAASSVHGEQIRAVPVRRGIHPAWWIAAALAVMLVSVVTWVLLRPTEVPAFKPRLPLKLDRELEAQAPAAPKTIQTPVVIPTNVPDSVIPGQQTASPDSSGMDKDKAESVSSANAAVSMPAKPEERPPVATAMASKSQTKESSIQPPSELARKSAADKRKNALVEDAPVAKAEPRTRQEPASAIAKQMKEPSPQQRAENEYRKGLTAMQQGRWTEAIAAFEQALQLDPRNAGARHALIGALIDVKRTDEALRRAREGLTQDPAQPGLAMIQARLQMEKGELASAIETLERALPYGSDRADYQAFLAALLQRDRRHKEAIDHYLAALKTAPQNGVWWMGAGISLQADSRLPEAREAFKRAKSTGSLTPELTAFVDGRLAQLGQ